MTRLHSAPVPPSLCRACDDSVTGPLEEWGICSPVCAELDRLQRFARPKPDGEYVEGRQDWEDWHEEQRQAARERRLEVALVERHRLGGPDQLEERDWLELAEADLGNYQGAEITRRIGELVALYQGRAARFPELSTMDAEAARRRLWGMVPMNIRGRTKA